MNPKVEDAYWSANYDTREYVVKDRKYADYQAAYRYGWESRARLGNRPFHEAAVELERGWDGAKGGSKLLWTAAKHAVKDAWNRIV